MPPARCMYTTLTGEFASSKNQEMLCNQVSARHSVRSRQLIVASPSESDLPYLEFMATRGRTVQHTDIEVAVVLPSQHHWHFLSRVYRNKARALIISPMTIQRRRCARTSAHASQLHRSHAVAAGWTSGCQYTLRDLGRESMGVVAITLRKTTDTLTISLLGPQHPSPRPTPGRSWSLLRCQLIVHCESVQNCAAR